MGLPDALILLVTIQALTPPARGYPLSRNPLPPGTRVRGGEGEPFRNSVADMAG